MMIFDAKEKGTNSKLYNFLPKIFLLKTNKCLDNQIFARNFFMEYYPPSIEEKILLIWCTGYPPRRQGSSPI
jgi:hypothetical protein